MGFILQSGPFQAWAMSMEDGKGAVECPAHMLLMDDTRVLVNNQNNVIHLQVLESEGLRLKS